MDIFKTAKTVRKKDHLSGGGKGIIICVFWNRRIENSLRNNKFSRMFPVGNKKSSKKWIWKKRRSIPQIVHSKQLLY